MISKNTLRSIILIVMFFVISLFIFMISNHKNSFDVVYFTDKIEYDKNDNKGILIEKTLNEIFKETEFQAEYKILSYPFSTEKTLSEIKPEISILDNSILSEREIFYAGKNENTLTLLNGVLSKAERENLPAGFYTTAHDLEDIYDAVDVFLKKNDAGKILLVYDNSGKSNLIHHIRESGFEARDINIEDDKNLFFQKLGEELAEYTPDQLLLCCDDENLSDIINMVPGFPRERILIVSDFNPKDIFYYCGINSIGIKFLSSYPYENYSSYSPADSSLKSVLQKIAICFLDNKSVKDSGECVFRPQDENFVEADFENGRRISPVYLYLISDEEIVLADSYSPKKDVY